jgi:hypothetical protein
MPSLASGVSLTALTVIVTVARSESSAPSLARYVKVTGPLTFEAGVYVNEPLPFRARIPLETSVAKTAVSASKSASVSFPSTPGRGTVSGTSSATL